MAEPDVIIVGAGAAGLGAARRLAGAGVPVRVIEARNRQDEEYGEERLVDCLLAAGRDRPRTLLDRVFASVREFCEGAEASDDITVTVTQFLTSE